ncbi:MAG: hypothetical protein NT069_36040 [Planctomycetota bacterium]|nr:hypothetical protein [Planctomycetota bacterium]
MNPVVLSTETFIPTGLNPPAPPSSALQQVVRPSKTNLWITRISFGREITVESG